MTSAVRGSAVGVLVFLLAACAAPRGERPDDPAAAWAQHRDRVETIESWRVEGRLSVRGSQEGRRSAAGGTVGFDWHEQPGAGFRLDLAGAWGQSVARVQADGRRARLDVGDGRVFVGTDARQLLADVYGWDIPVAGLRRWLLGLAGEGADPASYELDRRGRLASLEWREWLVEYRRYRQVDGLDLPVDLVATRADGGARLRVIVDRWMPQGRGDAAEDNGRIPLIGD